MKNVVLCAALLAIAFTLSGCWLFAPDANPAQSPSPVPRNQSPVAKLSVGPKTYGVAPLGVTVDTAGSSDPDGSIASVSINFGDGTVIEAASATHTYTANGAFAVVATVKDDDGASAKACALVMVSATGEQTVMPSLVASRTSGYAPLAVHFDATGAMSAVPNVSDPANGGAFRQIKHEFDFGDPGSGTHSLDGMSRNSEPLGGPLAAHVFEKPGTYTVTVTSTDGVGAPVTASTQITVDDPASLRTYAISKSGDFTGAPAGAEHLAVPPTTSTWTAFESDSRYFFRSGEDWSDLEIRIQDPVHNLTVGAFGSGAKPVFDVVNVGIYRPATSQFANDIRVCDIHANRGLCQELGSRILFLRCDADSSSGAGMSYLPVDQYRVVPQEEFVNPHELFFVDCRLDGRGTQGAYAWYGSGSRLVFLDTFMGGIQKGTTRVVAWDRGVMRHCRIESPYIESSVSALKAHSGGTHDYDDNWLVATGGENTVYGWKTSKVVIADNKFGGGRMNVNWTLAICPTNSGPAVVENEVIEDVIVENNDFIHLPGWNGFDVAYYVRRLSIRGNTAVWEGGASGSGEIQYGVGHHPPDMASYDLPLFIDQ